MSGRCGCSSAAATGVAMAGGRFIDVSGSGTPTDPFFVALDAGVLPTIPCTSTSRPSGPAAGQMIFETNTGKVMVWSGSEWVPTQRADGPLSGGTVIGPAPTDADRVYPKMGSAVIDLGSPGTGGFTIPLPRGPYPTSLVHMSFAAGDTLPSPLAPWFAIPIQPNQSLSQLNGIVFRHDGTPIISGLVRINYEAWGF